MRILITGATGSLGRALLTRLKGAHEVTGVHSKFIPNAPDYYAVCHECKQYLELGETLAPKTLRHEFERARLLEFVKKHIAHTLTFQDLNKFEKGYIDAKDCLESTKIFGIKSGERFYQVYESGLEAERDDCVEWLAYSYLYNKVLYSKRVT